jgi:hypothetical protein
MPICIKDQLQNLFQEISRIANLVPKLLGDKISWAFQETGQLSLEILCFIT